MTTDCDWWWLPMGEVCQHQTSLSSQSQFFPDFSRMYYSLDRSKLQQYFQKEKWFPTKTNWYNVKQYFIFRSRSVLPDLPCQTAISARQASILTFSDWARWERSWPRRDWPDRHQDSTMTDVIFVCGSVGFSAHKFLLASVSPLLQRLLSQDLSLDLQTRSSSKASLTSSSLSSGINDDTESLIRSEDSTPCRRWRLNFKLSNKFYNVSSGNLILREID